MKRRYHQNVDLAAGTRLGPYEITGIVGAGGMGEVYRARDTRLGREVAIKVLPANVSTDARLRERLSREARAISSLAHPNICTLFDVGHQDGIDFLVMELLDGQSLADAIEGGPLPPDKVLRYGAQIADAIAAAHRQGVIHRDLKPGNIMLTKSGAKVLDFGLAVSTTSKDDEATQQRGLTEEGRIVGTLPYMAPEQLQGLAADARSDIYAIGAILYEMATGHRAFQGSSREAPAPLTPTALDHIVRRCLASDPDDRLQSARDLEFALQEMTQPQDMVARSRRTPMAAVIAAFVVLAAAGAWLMLRDRTRAADVSHPRTIAVVPFASLGVDKSRDYLRLAIPDEITTILTYSPELSVRPFSAARKMAADIDPQEAAKKLNAAAIISGHLMDAGGRLNVTLEAIDIANDKLLWRDVFEVASADLITMRGELSSRIRGGLLPRLSLTSPIAERGAPKSAEAYALFLRASALSTDPEPNKQGLQMLEDAVRIDPSFAPAWNALAQRSYYYGTYSDGGRVAMARSEEAAARALQLDPDLVEASTQLISMRTEQGQTIEALRDAKQLVARRPASAHAHWVLATVLRYGGALEESSAECNTALSIDPRNRGFRSCALTFEQRSDYERAREFMRLDPGSQWSQRIEGGIHLRQGKYEGASRFMQAGPIRNLIELWVAHAPAADMDRAALDVTAMLPSRKDGESFFYIGSFLSLCGYPKEGFEALRIALQRNYCSVPAIDSDPLWANTRSLPEFAAFHEEAVRCHERFMAELAKH